MAREDEQNITGLLDVLDDRARYAVEQRFGLQDGTKRSYREVGEDLGVTAEAARRLVKRAVNTVREHAAARTRGLTHPPSALPPARPLGQAGGSMDAPWSPESWR